MLDVKAWDAENHLRLTGADNDLVKRNLDFLATAGKLEEVRTVVAPDWMNPEETVEAVSRRLASLGAANTRYKIIRYRPMGVRSEYSRSERAGEGTPECVGGARECAWNRKYRIDLGFF